MMLLFIYLSLVSVTLSVPITTTEGKINVECAQDGDCVSNSVNCQEICGCDGFYYFNDTINECLLDMDLIRQLMVERHSDTEEKIRRDAERVFNGIIGSVLFFMTCASLCATTACIYCFRINYTDQKLANDVKALEDKLKRDGIRTGDPKKALKKYPKPSGESCTIVDADAGVFVC